jgi:hypothetical protein
MAAETLLGYDRYWSYRTRHDEVGVLACLAVKSLRCCRPGTQPAGSVTVAAPYQPTPTNDVPAGQGPIAKPGHPDQRCQTPRW